MPFVRSDDEALIEQVVTEFARDQIGLDAAADLDRHDRFPTDFVAASAQLGLAGVTLTEAEGGAGAGPTAYVLALSALAAVCPNTAAVLATHNGMGLRLLAEAGNQPTLLAAAASGELVCTLSTEEAHGGDKTRLGTVAVPDPGPDGGWRITGMKVWGLAAEGARHFLVLARTDDGPTWFVVPADAPGLVIGHNEPLLGLRASGIRTVYLTEVQVPADAVVGAPGQALPLMDKARPWLQLGAAACIVGAVQGAHTAATAFAESRVQFGKPIAMFQAVSDAVTEVDMTLAAARALVLEAAAHLDAPDAALWAARAKGFAADAAIPLTRRSIRIQGGTGFMREGGTERFARDVRALQFVGEPPFAAREIMKKAVLDVAW